MFSLCFTNTIHDFTVLDAWIARTVVVWKKILRQRKASPIDGSMITIDSVPETGFVFQFLPKASP